MEQLPWYMYINYNLLGCAAGLFCVYIIARTMRKKHNINLDAMILNLIKGAKIKKSKCEPIIRATGENSLVLLSAGVNKATVQATLRQILDIDQEKAQKMVASAPTTILQNVSFNEASLSKEALEFVGAELAIK